MGRWSTLGSLLFFLGLSGTCTGFEEENCTNYRLSSIGGALQHHWYDSKTRQEISNETGRTAVRGETLWFLNTRWTTMKIRERTEETPSGCYRQNTRLIVELPVPGECGRPRKAGQTITKGVTDYLGCPLKEYISKLNSYKTTYSLMWAVSSLWMGMTDIATRITPNMKIDKVETTNQQSYTCTLTFTLDGTVGSVSESIEAWVNVILLCNYGNHKLSYCGNHKLSYCGNHKLSYCGNHKLSYCGNHKLSSCGNHKLSSCGNHKLSYCGNHKLSYCGNHKLSYCGNHKLSYCGNHKLSYWGNHKLSYCGNHNKVLFDPTSAPTSRWDNQGSDRTRSETVPVEGVWMERVLTISKLQEKDYNINYTCYAFSARGKPQSYFTLLPTDPDLRLPIGMILGNVAVLFIVSVILYYLFKVDIVLCFRRMFLVFYTNTDSDGKLYDAYVAYSQPNTEGFSNEVEAFVFHTLPEVLEKACGYKLFLAGRDCVPGMAIVDSVEENIQGSRRLLLLYTASTFMRKRLTSGISNNNITKSSDGRDSTENSESKKESDRSSNTSFDGGEENYPDSRQQLEHLAAMHRSLLEGSLKVILVELEEITPAQLALFPESVRHLRKKQGAVCWWKNQERGGKMEDMFWKEMRYHMPVKGKRAMCPEKATLLNVR
ncbi:hypothetical protein KUCAC02_019335 [Chaenocephalus aceratus]|nr:hypothetical protein KUCAC02_019335 [Chaenocephalus aceratus]